MAMVCSNVTPSSTLRGFHITSLSGSPNLQASHTIMGRVKFTTATTASEVWPLYFGLNSTSSFSGSVTAHKSTGAATTQIATRFDTSGNADVVTQTGSFATGTWRHYAMVYNTTGTLITFYIDGVSVGTVSSATTRTSSSTANRFVLGWCQGLVADAAVYNRALSAGEVAQMAAYRVATITSGLLGFWRLDANGNDTSGNAQTLVSFGTTGTTPTFSTSDNPPQPEDVTLAGAAASSSAFAGGLTSLVTGSAASSSAFAGQAQALVKGDAASSSAFVGALRAAIGGATASSSAFSAWIRPRWGRRVESPGGTDISGAISVSATSPWTIMGWRKTILASSGSFAEQVISGTSAVVSLNANNSGLGILFADGVGNVINYSTTDNGAWHHMAVSFDGTTARAYLDGSLVASGNPTSLSGSFTLAYFNGSATAVAEYAHGKLWTAQLTATEIGNEATYYTPYNKLASLYAWWQLSWQNVTLDSSGNGNTLTDSGSTEAQNESPGLQMFLLAGSAASSSAFAGSLGTTKPLAGAAASSSAFAAAATALVAGQAASSSALAGQLAALLSGSAASSSAFAGTLNTAKPLAGAAASSSALSAALQALLTGSAASSSAFSGSLGTTKQLAGDAASSSAFTGTLGISGLFAGNMASSSAFSGTLFVTRPLAGSMASSSAFTGALGQTFPIAGTLASGSAFSGTLFIPVNLTGSAASSSTLTGTLSLTIGVAGNAASSSAFQGTITAQIRASAASSSAFTGALQLANFLTSSLASSSAFTGAITVVALRPVAGAANSDSALAGSLSVTQIMAAIGGDTYTGSSVDQVFWSDADPGPLLPQRQWPPRPR